MSGIHRVVKVCAIVFAVFLIVQIVGVILCGIGLITGFEYQKTKKIEFNQAYDNVQNIEIDSVSSNLSIQVGEQLKVEASGVNDDFTSEVKDGTLKIKEKKKNWILNTQFSGEIVVYVPEEIFLNKIKIDAGAGKISIDGISASVLDLDQGAGTLSISNSEFKKTDIDGGAGKIEVTSSLFNQLDLDAGVGEIDIMANITGNSKIDCGVGEIKLSLLGNKDDYRISVEKGIGSIQIDGQNYSSDTVIGDGVNFIKLEGGVGSISVHFVDSVF